MKEMMIYHEKYGAFESSIAIKIPFMKKYYLTWSKAHPISLFFVYK